MSAKTRVVFNGQRMNFYEFFEVPETANDEEMKAAYRKLCMRFHPDKHGGSDLYLENFKAIQQIWAVLGDKERRAQYDAILAMERGVQPAQEGFSIRFFWSSDVGTQSQTAGWARYA